MGSASLDPQTISVVDSLRHVIAAHESLLATQRALIKAAAARPNVAGPAVHAPRDWVDYLQLLASLLVAPVVAVFAARVGAKIGGEEARKAAEAGHRQQVIDDRKLQQEELAANDNRQLQRLLRRVQRDTVNFGGIAMGFEIVPEMVLDSQHVEALRLLWEGFLPRRDDLLLLQDDELERKVEHFYGKALSLAGWIERHIAEKKAAVGRTVTGDEVNRLTTQERVYLQALRHHVDEAEDIYWALDTLRDDGPGDAKKAQWPWGDKDSRARQ